MGKLKSVAKYVGSIGKSKDAGKDFAIGKGQVFTVKRSPAQLDKIRKRYEGIEEKRGKGAAKKELKTILESRNARGKSNKSVPGLVNAVVRSEAYDHRAKNMMGQTRSFQDKAQARRWAKGKSYGGPSEVSKAKVKPDTKDFQKAAGSKATVGLDTVKPKSRAQKAVETPIVTKTEPVTSDEKVPRAEVTAVEKLPEYKVDKKTGKLTPAETRASEVREERRDATRGARRGRRDQKKSWKRYMPFTEARRKHKLDKRRKKVQRAEEEEEVASREDEIKIERTRRRARLSEAKARKSEADRFKRGYI